MDGEGQTPDDLRINLTWPGDDTPEGERPARRAGVERRPPRPVDQGEPDTTTSLARPRPAAPADDLSTRMAHPPADWPAITEPVPISEIAPAPRVVPVVDEQMAARLARVAEETTATRSRLDTLTDAVITLRAFLNDRVGDVNERVGDLGQAVSRSEALLSREISAAVDRLPVPVEVDVESILERSRAGLADQLQEAVHAAQVNLAAELDQALVRITPPSAEVAAQVGQIHDAVDATIERAFGRLNVQVGRHLDEVIAESRAQTVSDLQQVVADAQARLVNHLDEAVAATQRQTGQHTRELQQEFERSNTAISALTGLTEANGAGVDRLGDALTAELAAVAEALSEGIDRSADALRKETKAGSERAIADLNLLGENVAHALNQVADRLERLALRNGDQENVVEAVADALDDVAGRVDELDQAGRSRHDRLIAVVNEVRTATTQAAKPDLRAVNRSIAAIEANLEALLAASDRHGDELRARPGVDPSVERALADLADAAGRQATAISKQKPADPAVTGALSDIAEQLDQLIRLHQADAGLARTSYEGVSDTLGRLASAQAEDLERILEAVEALATSTGDAPSFDALEGVLTEQLGGVTAQIEALRRRMSVRARTPELSDEAIEKLAKRVATQLGSVWTMSSAPTTPPSASRRSTRR